MFDHVVIIWYTFTSRANMIYLFMSAKQFYSIALAECSTLNFVDTDTRKKQLTWSNVFYEKCVCVLKSACVGGRTINCIRAALVWIMNTERTCCVCAWAAGDYLLCAARPYNAASNGGLSQQDVCDKAHKMRVLYIGPRCECAGEYRSDCTTQTNCNMTLWLFHILWYIAHVCVCTRRVCLHTLTPPGCQCRVWHIARAVPSFRA